MSKGGGATNSSNFVIYTQTLVPTRSASEIDGGVKHVLPRTGTSKEPFNLLAGKALRRSYLWKH